VLADDKHLARANLVAGVLALVLLAAGLTRTVPVGIPLAITLIGAEYVGIIGFEADALDTRAPLVAGALVAIAELAYWSLELRRRVVDEAGTYLRRIALLAALVLGVVGLGVGVMTLVETIAAGGIAIDIFGAAAALGALALLARAARRTVP
jgi:hypothetical protein